MFPMSGVGFMGKKKGAGPTGDFFTFKTTFEGEVSFDITQSGGETAIWYMGDGTILANTNAVTHVYSDPGEKTVSVAVTGFEFVTAIGDFREKQITFFDAKDLNNLSVSFVLANNPMASVLMPTSQIGAFSFIQVWSTLLSELNLQGVNFEGLARLWAQGCNLSSIAINTGEVINDLRLENNDFTSIDLSQVDRNSSNLSLQWDVSENPDLISVSMPATTQANRLGTIRANNCPLITEFDISMFFPGGVRAMFFQFNTSLSSVIWPAEGSVDFESSALRLDSTDIEFVDLRWNNFGFGPGAPIFLMNTPNAKWLKVAPGSVYRFATQSNGNNHIRIENSAIESVDFSPAETVSGNLTASNCPNLTEFLLPANNSLYNPHWIRFMNCPILASDLNVANHVLTAVNSQLHVINCPLLTNINLSKPGKITCPAIRIINTGVITLDMGDCICNGGTAQTLVQGNLELTTLTLPSITGVYSNGIFFSGNPLLSDVIFTEGPYWSADLVKEVNISGNALTAASIDKFLVDLDNYVTSSSRGVLLNGGTSSPPTDGSVTGFDGIAAKASLEFKGMTITTN